VCGPWRAGVRGDTSVNEINLASMSGVQHDGLLNLLSGAVSWSGSPLEFENIQSVTLESSSGMHALRIHVRQNASSSDYQEFNNYGYPFDVYLDTGDSDIGGADQEQQQSASAVGFVSQDDPSNWYFTVSFTGVAVPQFSYYEDGAIESSIVDLNTAPWISSLDLSMPDLTATITSFVVDRSHAGSDVSGTRAVVEGSLDGVRPYTPVTVWLESPDEVGSDNTLGDKMGPGAGGW
jgi:hypothetical protein